MAAAFEVIDRNRDGVLSRIEVIKACRSNAYVRSLLGLPSVIRQEDGSRDRFEAVFQAIDVDDSKAIDPTEFSRLFMTLRSATTQPGRALEEEVQPQRWQSLEGPLA